MALTTETLSKSLLAKEHKFDSLVKSLNSLNVGLSVINKEMRIAWVNQVMIDIFGPSEKIYGQHCYEVYAHRKRICPNCPTVKALRTGKPGFSAIQRGIDKNNQVQYHKLISAPVINNGKIVEALEVVQDVTKEVIAKKQKKYFQRQLKEQVRKKTSELDLAIKELSSVYAVSREIISTLDLQEVFLLVAKAVCLIIHTKACVLRMVDKANRQMPIVSSYGLSKEYVDNTPLKIGEGLSGIIAETGKPIICPQVSKKDSIKYSYYITGEGYSSALGVPIIFKDEVLGSILTYDETVRDYTKNEVMLLSTFASEIAIAIKNAQLYKKVRSNYLNTVSALALAVEARDPYTHGHSERVTAYAIEIARAEGLPKKQIQIIQRCGTLHDVGKIAVPDTILRKAGPLTKKERAIIQLHPAKGVDMLAPLEFLERGFPLIKHHHERFDGKGYPQGLKGKKIPTIARIFSCADAFDAMTSDRPYRSRLTFKQAIAELKKNAGSQFDPCLVKKFVLILERKT